MGFLNKLGIGLGAGTGREVSRSIPANNGRSHGPATIAAIGATRPPERGESVRLSNGKN